MCLNVTASSLGVAIERPVYEESVFRTEETRLRLARRRASRAFRRSHSIFPDCIHSSLKALFAFACRHFILTMTSADVRDMLDLPTGDGHPRPAKKQKVVEKRPGSAMSGVINEHC